MGGGDRLLAGQVSERSQSPQGMTTEQVPSVRVLCSGPGRQAGHETAEESGDEPIAIPTHLILIFIA